MSEEDKKTASPVIRISITSVVGDKKQMSFETYVDQLTPVTVVNGLVDKIMAVADRQVAAAEIKDLERLYSTETNQLEALKGDLIRVDKMHKQAMDARGGQRVGAYKLLPKEDQERRNILTNIEVRTKRLADMLADIEKRKAIVGSAD